MALQNELKRQLDSCIVSMFVCVCTLVLFSRLCTLKHFVYASSQIVVSSHIWWPHICTLCVVQTARSHWPRTEDVLILIYVFIVRSVKRTKDQIMTFPMFLQKLDIQWVAADNLVFFIYKISNVYVIILLVAAWKAAILKFSYSTLLYCDNTTLRKHAYIDTYKNANKNTRVYAS